MDSVSPSASARPVFDRKLVIALTLYLTALFASNTVGIKIMPFIFGTHLSTAIFAFPLVFLTTDVVGEVYGKAHARAFVRMGFYSMVVFLIFNALSNVMPTSSEFRMPEAYNQIFSLSLRFTFASLMAFIIGEYQDVFSFFFLKAKLGGRAFWLRSNLSNLWGQFIDSSIWFAIAFIGVYPFRIIVLMMIPWWLFKFGMGVVYTPLSYVGIWLLRRPER
ncbi:MAG: queuosine precursor transporter [Candidatus Peribacteraceae bacterium]|nr:queuosine precursor transporter [Candidatus Peribacteraceae bacterium]MDD5739523.1 queuosine precursor transporter [Candidatus Peribacteraceae bacterium]